MSVLACNRAGCENVMCNRYSDTYGYICDECFEELDRLPVLFSVRAFMAEPKRAPIIPHSRRGFLESIFPKD